MSFDVIMVPYVPWVVLHQETIFFLQMMSSLDILGINCLTSVSLEVFIQVDEVNLNRFFSSDFQPSRRETHKNVRCVEN